MRTLQLVSTPPSGSAPNLTLTLTLTWDGRRKSRQRVRLDDGSEAAVLLPRGTALHDGDLLHGDDGVTVRVSAASETLSEVRSADPFALARAAYHLGNRHVPLQLAQTFLRYSHDHVLDDMVRALGLTVAVVQAPFEAEQGAYHGGHGHTHDGSHDPHDHDSHAHHHHE